MKYRLIFVEGLPGTGKSTLSEQIYDMLVKKRISSELLLEDNEKIPSNFYYIAAIPKSDFVGFSVDEAIIEETENYFFINRKKCKEEMAKMLQRYDVGDEFNKSISLQEYICCTLEWWRNWVVNFSNESILILDSAFMQCPINEMIFRGASDSQAKEYIQAIAEIIKPFNPICVYLRRENATIAIDFAKVVKGEHWAKGIDGLAQSDFPDLFERRFYLENELLSLIPNIVCDIDGYDWSDTEIKLKELL